MSFIHLSNIALNTITFSSLETNVNILLYDVQFLLTLFLFRHLMYISYSSHILKHVR